MPGTLAGASWPAYDAEAARAEEIVDPGAGQRQGPRPADRPADTPEQELERLALADPGVQPYTRGKDGEEGGRCQRPAGQHRGRMRGRLVTRRERLRAAALCRRRRSALAGCGYSLAGRGSFLPYVYPRASPSRCSSTARRTSTVEQMFTEKVRVEFQSRGQYAVQPTEPGADGVVRGEIDRHRRRSGRLQPSSSWPALPFHGHGQRQVRRCDAAEDAVGEPGAELQRRVRAVQRRTSTGLGATAFLDQERAAIDRLSDRLRALRRVRDSRGVLSRRDAGPGRARRSPRVTPARCICSRATTCRPATTSRTSFSALVERGCTPSTSQRFYASEAGTAAGRDQLIGAVGGGAHAADDGAAPAS